jgi:hypothetical protein
MTTPIDNLRALIADAGPNGVVSVDAVLAAFPALGRVGQTAAARAAVAGVLAGIDTTDDDALQGAIEALCEHFGLRPFAMMDAAGFGEAV